MVNWVAVLDRANQMALVSENRYKIYGRRRDSRWRYYIALSDRVTCPECDGTKWFPCDNTFCGDHLCHVCGGKGLVDRGK